MILFIDHNPYVSRDKYTYHIAFDIHYTKYIKPAHIKQNFRWLFLLKIFGDGKYENSDTASYINLTCHIPTKIVKFFDKPRFW